MAYALVTAVTDLDDLLDKLYTFATVTDGTWTGVYNEDLARRQIGLSKGNCFVALGSRAADLGIDRGGGSIDSMVSMALSTSLTGTNKQYWGHPGSLVTTESDSDRILVNDLGGPPFSNVWFFSNAAGLASYIHCVVQSSGERYSHFGFGVFDKLGMTTADCAFAVGVYHEWWPDGPIDCNDPASAQHEIGHLGDTELNAHVFVPASVLPAGYPATPAVFLTDQITRVMERVNNASDHWTNQTGSILDFFRAVSNQLTTGGTALYGLPWFFSQVAAGTTHCFVGILPGVKLANISIHTPSTVLDYGGEKHVIFPWKRKGLASEAQGGGSEVNLANTVDYAFAYRKNV